MAQVRLGRHDIVGFGPSHFVAPVCVALLSPLLEHGLPLPVKAAQKRRVKCRGL